MIASAYCYFVYKTEHPSKPKQHQCDICGRSFAAEGWLNKHVMDVHGEDGKQTFKCLVCGVDFPRESLLQVKLTALPVISGPKGNKMQTFKNL